MRLIDANKLANTFLNHCYPVQHDGTSVEPGMTYVGILQAIQEQPTIEPPNKALYRFYNDGQYVKVLLLTDDQAAVFYWLENLGVPIILEPDDVREPEEIKPEDVMKMD